MERFVPHPYAVTGALIREAALREQFRLTIHGTRWEYDDTDPSNPWFEVTTIINAGCFSTVTEIVHREPELLAHIGPEVTPSHAEVRDRHGRLAAAARFALGAFAWLMPPTAQEESVLHEREQALEQQAREEIALADNFSSARWLRKQAERLRLQLALDHYYRPYVRREFEALNVMSLH
ncbi:hypothetical protein IOC61_02875 [Halomonas sp. KAO]|uniref:hypothetical protein n=1 Tax=Halomonas TaxID=2745 RepID=UPI00048294DD|nr:MULTISPECIES: hypothetical protein [Halomonas]MBF7052258.1 hypothetical protein [Halomonas sp. KAO]